MCLPRLFTVRGRFLVGTRDTAGVREMNVTSNEPYGTTRGSNCPCTNSYLLRALSKQKAPKGTRTWSIRNAPDWPKTTPLGRDESCGIYSYKLWHSPFRKPTRAGLAFSATTRSPRDVWSCRGADRGRDKTRPEGNSRFPSLDVK